MPNNCRSKVISFESYHMNITQT